MRKSPKIKDRFVIREEDQFRKTEISNLVDGCSDAGEVDHFCDPCNCKKCRNDISDDQSDQNVQVLIDTFQEITGNQTYNQCDQSDQ